MKLLAYATNAPSIDVTPLAGVWIEITGLRLSSSASPVTPLAGVWIEIVCAGKQFSVENVTPLAGVWIEISYNNIWDKYNKSLPLRECGLKYH